MQLAKHYLLKRLCFTLGRYLYCCWKWFAHIHHVVHLALVFSIVLYICLHGSSMLFSLLCNNFLANFEIRVCESSTVVLFQDCFESLVVPWNSFMNFRMISISAKTHHGILMGIALNLKIALGTADILSHSTSFHTFVYSLLFFTSILYF